MTRKTIAVENIVNQVNTFLANSAEDMVGERNGAMMMLESILHNTGNYGGFRHLYDDEVEGNPGCRPHDGPRYVSKDGLRSSSYYEANLIDTWFVDTDETRRQY